MKKLPKRKSIKINAPLWKRMVAFITDLIIINFVLVRPFQTVLAKLVPGGDVQAIYDSLMKNPDIVSSLTNITIFLAFLSMLYFAILEYKIGQSAGKIMMNIKVESTKKELKFWHCLLRSIFLLSFFPFVLLWAIDPVYMFFNKDNQRLTEKISNTKVVEELFLK